MIRLVCRSLSSFDIVSVPALATTHIFIRGGQQPIDESARSTYPTENDWPDPKKLRG